MAKKITIEVSDTVYGLLAVLGSVEEVVGLLVDHAQQGVYRPGAWERDWLIQVFGDDWTAELEAGDPYGMENGFMFQRPRSRG